MNTVPTTSCDEAAALVLRRMEGWLDGDEGVRLDAHLETCDACRHELAAQREVADVLAGRPDRAAPLGFTTRIMARLESEPAWLDLVNWQFWTFRLAPVAAVLVVVAAFGFGPTEAAEPIEFADLVSEWAAEETGSAPPFSVLWQDDVSDDLLLETVFTAADVARR